MRTRGYSTPKTKHMNCPIFVNFNQCTQCMIKSWCQSIAKKSKLMLSGLKKERKKMGNDFHIVQSPP